MQAGELNIGDLVAYRLVDGANVEIEFIRKRPLTEFAGLNAVERVTSIEMLESNGLFIAD